MEHYKLLSEINNEGIEVIEMTFNGSTKGLYADNIIAINKEIDTFKEKNCVLAEELGHHHTSFGNILELNANIRNAKQEKRARNWAYEKLAGIVSIINAFEKGIRTKNDLAEYLDVTEEFLEQAVNHYREKYGTHYQVDNYIIYFEPSLQIVKLIKML